MCCAESDSECDEDSDVQSEGSDAEEEEAKQIVLHESKVMEVALKVQQALIKEPIHKARINRKAGRKDLAARKQGKLDALACEYRPLKKLKN